MPTLPTLCGCEKLECPNRGLYEITILKRIVVTHQTKCLILRNNTFPLSFKLTRSVLLMNYL